VPAARPGPAAPSGFPELISADGALRDLADTAFLNTNSLLRLPFTRMAPRIRDLAEGLRSQIEVRYPDYKSIILVCHSLGGLVARKYLVEEVKRGKELRIDKLLLFAVPTMAPASPASRNTYPAAQSVGPIVPRFGIDRRA